MLKKLIALLACLVAAPLVAQVPPAMSTGPAITEYGPVARVKPDMPIPPGTKFKVAFDVAARNTTDKPLRQFESLARFINMLAGNGIPENDVDLALVVHGQATFDLLEDRAYPEGKSNPSRALIMALQEHGVRVIVCGQSVAGLGLAREDLLPGVEVALSAMTAHAILQQDGYTLNPF
jgi:intracellular sulfur oxidation DsrE/DsrF family protein